MTTKLKKNDNKIAMKKTVIILSAIIFSTMQVQAYDFSIQKIDSVKYFISKEKTNIQKRTLEEITNLEQARKMLKGRVVRVKYDEETDECIEDELGNFISKIVCDNGKTYSYNSYQLLWFVAYYPQQDVLLCEGGHTSDVSFNLTTGAEREDVGNPRYYVYSSSEKYLLNGYDDGQECSAYFIQEKIGGQYQKIIFLERLFEDEIDFRFCWILDAFWENDTILNIITTKYPGEKHEKLYYRIVLK